MSHLSDLEETYWQHATIAIAFGGRLVLLGMICMIHGVCPEWFTATTSTAVKSMAEEFAKRTG